MKMGTLACWLFGHKCIGDRPMDNAPSDWVEKVPLNYCIRCGKQKYEIKVVKPKRELK